MSTSSSIPIIRFESVSKSYGPKVVIHPLSLAIHRGQRLALVGENGCGKTTLAKLALGLEQPDGGSIWRMQEVSIGYLPQDSAIEALGETTVGATLLASQGCLHALARRLSELEELMADPGAASLELLMAEWDGLYSAFLYEGGYGAMESSKEVLSLLGLGELSPDCQLKDLSGGERRRLELATLLIRRPDLLVLDEPTNHLDREAVAELESYLSGYKGALLLISHDREFLNRVVNGLFELSSLTHAITYYSGNYDTYKRTKEADLAAKLKLAESRQEEITHLKRSLKAATFSSPRAAPAKDGNKMAYDKRGERHARGESRSLAQAKDRLEELERSKVDQLLPKGYTGILFQPKPLEGNCALSLEGLSISAGDRQLFEGFSAELRPGERAILAGPNGCGKSTLLRQIALHGRGCEGKIVLASTASIGYLDQEGRLEDGALLLMDYLLKRSCLPEHELRSRLHRMALIDTESIHQRVEALSLGQKRRLQLLELMLSGANLLLLDEPTNHLAPSLIDELEEALLSFQGAMIIATHDRRFASNIGTVRWEW